MAAGGFGAGWPEHHQPLSASQQHHLERDYATTLQMRRTVLPSSVIPRYPNDDHSSSTCVCPLHGLHHPAAAATVSSTANPVAAHRAWTSDSGSGASEMPRSPAAVEGGPGNARFSTFRPRVEHIYEVPRFTDGQEDANVADYDGVMQRVGYDDDNDNNGKRLSNVAAVSSARGPEIVWKSQRQATVRVELLQQWKKVNTSPHSGS